MKLNILLTIAVAVLAPISAAAAFRDVPTSHPNATAINYVQELGIVSGYIDGTYRPSAYINRAEFIKILMYYKYGQDMVEKCGSNYFSDVPYEAWYRKPICRAKDAGIIEGYSDRTFRPEQLINFAEAAKITAETDTSEFGGPSLPPETSGPWYERYVQYLADNRAIPLSVQSLDSQVTRGEMAEMIYRLAERSGAYESHTYESLTGGLPADSRPNILAMSFRVHSSLRLYRLTLNLQNGNLSFTDPDGNDLLTEDAFYESPTLKQSTESLRTGTSQIEDFFQVRDVNGDEFTDVSFPSATMYKFFYFDPQSMTFKVEDPVMGPFHYSEPICGFATDPNFDPYQDCRDVIAREYQGRSCTFTLSSTYTGMNSCHTCSITCLKKASSSSADNGIEYCTAPFLTLASLPADQRYAVFGDLGKLFTANDCGTQRYKEALAVFPESVASVQLTLKGKPSNAFYNDLSATGFACNDSGFTSSAGCLSWTTYEQKTPGDFLPIKSYASVIIRAVIRSGN